MSENRYPHRPFSKRIKRESNAHLFAHTEFWRKFHRPVTSFAGRRRGYLPCSPTPESDSKSSANLCPSKSLEPILVGKFGLKSLTKNAGFLFKNPGRWLVSLFWFLVGVGLEWAAQSYLGFHDHLTMRQSTCIGRSWSLTFISGLHSRELKKRQRLFTEILSCGKSTTYSIKSCMSCFSNPITDPWDDGIFPTKNQQEIGSANVPSSHGSVMGMSNFYPHCFIFHYI